jgi:4-hydroxybenzoate polyprenyltransferase
MVSELSKIAAYIRLARPHIYTKNGLVALPLFFEGKLYDAALFVSVLQAFVIFCLCSSSVYGFNDLHDAKADRYHPVKQWRPLASGLLTRSEVVLFVISLLVISIFLSLALFDERFLFLLAGYLAWNVLYSLVLRKFAVVDVVCIAPGYVLRLLAGGVAAGVRVNSWLILTCFFGGLFIEVAQRWNDLRLTDSDFNYRPCLKWYNREFVRWAMVAAAVIAVVCYALYTLSPDVRASFGANNLYLSTFWVIVGLARYMQKKFITHATGVAWASDLALPAILVLWIASCYTVLYGWE